MSVNRLSSIAALLIAVVLPSCVGTKNIPLSAGDRAAMRGKSVISSRREMPAFGVIKPEAMALAGLGGAVGGAIAGNIANSQGKTEVAKHHLPVPEETISKQVLKTLVSKTGARELPYPTIMVADEKPAAIAAQYRPADYVLDIRTTGWMAAYYPMTLTKYYIVYGAKMRLIETSSGRVVAEGFSAYQGKDKDHAPNFDGIYSNDAAFLRAETKKGTDGATSVFSAQF